MSEILDKAKQEIKEEKDEQDKERAKKMLQLIEQKENEIEELKDKLEKGEYEDEVVFENNLVWQLCQPVIKNWKIVWRI